MQPLVIGKCSQLANGMSYDVPGGGKKGSNFVDQSDWVAPFNGRMLMASSHQHGGAKYHTLQSLTCKRRLFKAPVYHAPANHVYNTIRPILHEPGPIGTGAYASYRGIPIKQGEVLRRTAVHENHNLHVASMGFWATWFVKDDSVKKCGKLPKDIVEINKPKRFDRTPNYELEVPQLSKPVGAFATFDGNALTVGDDFFRPGRITSKVGQPVTWRFSGTKPHSVTVANGPRGFSSVYWGTERGTYTVTPKVKGTYKLVCLVHPTTMAETLVVEVGARRLLEVESARRVPLCASATLGSREPGPAGSSTIRVVAQRRASESSPVTAKTVSDPPSSRLRPAPNTRRRAPLGSESSESTTTTALAPCSTRALGALDGELGGLGLRLGRAVEAAAHALAADGAPFGHLLGPDAHERHLNVQIRVALGERGHDLAQQAWWRRSRARRRSATREPSP